MFVLAKSGIADEEVWASLDQYSGPGVGALVLFSPRLKKERFLDNAQDGDI